MNDAISEQNIYLSDELKRQLEENDVHIEDILQDFAQAHDQVMVQRAPSTNESVLAVVGGLEGGTRDIVEIIKLTIEGAAALGPFVTVLYDLIKSRAPNSEKVVLKETVGPDGTIIREITYETQR